MPSAAAPSAPPDTKSSIRSKLTEAARNGWIDRLIDTSRRNNLLFFRPIAGSTIEIEGSHPKLSEILSGETVRAAAFLPPTLDRPTRILTIARKALENQEEKGLQTLFLALGFATWKAEDGGRDYKAPVFLLPLSFSSRGSDYNSVDLSIAGELKVNPVLLHLLSHHFGIPLSEETLLPALPENTPEDATTNPEEQSEGDVGLYREKLNDLCAAASEIPEFRAECSAAIGNFSFAKMAMVHDLNEIAERMSDNQLIAAIAGDESARAGVISAQSDIEPRTLDECSPDSEFCVVEADSSQQCAINGIAVGQSAVVHGPPGTGKSQTITNLIATLVGQGKTVLFVAEKRAALEVVQQRLQRSKLGHLAIDLHGAELSSKKVMERVAETLNAVRHSKLPEFEALHSQFNDRRERLNAHDRRMHTTSPRTGQTLFQMQSMLLGLPEMAHSEVRWRGSELERLSPTRRIEIKNLLEEVSSLASLVLRTDSSPWTGIPFKEGAAAQQAIDTARRLAFDSLPALRLALSDLRQALGFAELETLALAEALCNFLGSIDARLDLYNEEVFSTDLAPALAQLERGSSALKALWLAFTSSEYKSAVRRAVSLRKGVKASAKMLHTELREAGREAERWRELTKGQSSPQRYPGRLQLGELAQECRKAVAALQQIRGTTWEGQAFDSLAGTVESFAKDQTTPYRLLKVTELETKLELAGAAKLLPDLRRRKPDSREWPQCFDYAWISSDIDELAVTDPEVKGFVGAAHSGYVEDFKKLDSDRLKIAVDRVRRAHAIRAIAAMNAHPGQEATIKAEAAKSRRHKPLRSLFRDSWDVLTAVCPCWMASPLSVSQLIDRGAQFDYVIFDEASQVLPEDAISAIMRAKHVIVAGDNQQLPPTGFFASGLDDGDEESAADGFESLLDMMLPFSKSFHLNWHYRSRDEALIAFSNHHIYKDRLVTFPGPGGGPAVAHLLVEHVPEADGQEESCAEEVRKVVQLVIKHALDNPGRTLGVISMGIKHAMRLQTAMDQALKSRPELAEFFDPGRSERFFIKNLERVQGDERDCIIISVGYGKNRAGDLPLRFGPILAAGGRRRLNVAITRARQSMMVVSSFSHLDIDATKIREGTGLEFLWNFLQYAASGGKLITQSEISGEPMNEFETDICVALEARGMKLVPQVGCSQFRIDFGVCHPEQAGRFVMAIECDGATYHSSATARDRDRLRQQMLMNLGWTFHRIWSTDWYFRREEEIERAWHAYRAALSKQDEVPTTGQQSAVDIVAAGPTGELISGASGRLIPSPPIPARKNITEYSHHELRRLYEWVLSDGILRTRDEIAGEMFDALPFNRRGSKIDETLRMTIANCEAG